MVDWRIVKQVFAEVLETAPALRTAYLAEACGDDAALREEVEALLAAHEQAPDFFEELAAAVFDPEDPLIGETVSRFVVCERLGGGGMGVVYRGEDLRLERAVALKFLPPAWSRDADARARFEREARAASALDHPNVCTLYEIGETADGRLFIAMAYYEGETLKKKIARGPMPVAEATDYALQMARGLAAAHARGIVHRDVKPANVMVVDPVSSDTGGGGLIKVVDFGVAKLAGDPQLTQAGDVMGTMAYMSPEQARGEAVDARTDVWALGMVLYEMLTGAHPFGEAYGAGMLYAIVNEPLPPLEGVPPVLAGIVRRCLARDPADRYASAAEVEAALAQERRGASPARSLPWEHVLRGVGVSVLSVLALIYVLSGGGSAGPEQVAHVFRGLSAAEPVGIGVLGFRTIGPHAATDGLAHGLDATLSSQLGRLQEDTLGFWVVAGSEIPDTMTARQAYLRYGIGLAVQGSVQGSDEGIRMTVQVTDAFTGRLVGARQVDAAAGTGGLALQDRAVAAVFDILEVTLPGPARAVLARGQTTVAGANTAYLRGLGYLRNYQTEADLDTALTAFGQALAADDGFALAYAGLGEAAWRKYGLSKDVAWADRAVEYSRQALTLDDGLPEVHVTLGIIFNGRDDYDAALAAYDAALAHDPGYAEAHRRRARVLYTLGRYDEAEAGYREAITLGQGYWRGYNSLGVFYLFRGRNTEAVATFNRGLRLAPENQSLLNNRSIVYWNMGAVEAAVAGFEQVLQVNPHYERARRNLARAYFYQGRYAVAGAYFEAQYARQPENHAHVAGLANVWFWIPAKRPQALDLYAQALSLARRHLAVSPRNVDLLGALATYHARLEHRDSAAVFLDRIEGLTTPERTVPGTAFGVGEVYEAIGRRADALRWMTSALARNHGRMELKHSPWLADLRRDAAFQDLSARFAL